MPRGSYRLSVRLLAGFLVVGLGSPAAAFYQTTAVEGPADPGISGVWLSVHQLMPEFRVRLERIEGSENPLPFEYGPIEADWKDELVGASAVGVMVTGITDGRAAGKHGIMVGDVISRLNGAPVVEPEAFRTAVAAGSGTTAGLSIRRPAIRFTKISLLKIEAPAAGAGDDGEEGSSGAPAEGDVEAAVYFFDVDLPFQAELDAARTANRLWHPGEDILKALRSGWHELPASDPIRHIKGEHRLVAASSYDADLLRDGTLADADLALVANLEGNPLYGGGGRTVAVYGFEDVGEGELRGAYTEATLASAPFPISIQFHGRFRMIRLAEYSDKDIEHRRALAEAAESQESHDDVELAPDIPE